MKTWKGADPDLLPNDWTPEYWIGVDKKTGNPTGDVCWAYYPEDRPVVGFWIKVKWTGETNEES